MAYREVRGMDVEQVTRRWLAGEKIRALARSTGLARNTVKRIVRLAREGGLKPGDAWPAETKLQAIREGIGRPGGSASNQAEQALLSRQDQIEHWLKNDRLLLTKIEELLVREGVAVSYSSLYRFASKHCGFGSPAVTVRRLEAQPGEVAEVDFGRLGLIHELGAKRPRLVHAFIMTLGYSRLSCVIPVFRQDQATTIDAFERCLEFFQGCPKRMVIDNLKACIDLADPYTPRFTRTFLEYAAYRRFLPDPARPRHPKDKPVVENSVRYVRERFFKGETFIDLDDIARRALIWCRDIAGRRIHGTTRAIPMEIFESEEKTALLSLRAERFDPPRWAQCKVHPDHHVRLDQALYSVPTRWVGCRVEVRADHSLVRIYSRGDLIKTHPRQKRGGRSTDFTDYPQGRAPFAMRWPDFYRHKARLLGSEAGDFVDQLLEGEFPWSRLRQAQKLLGLADRYGVDRLNAACRRALDFDLVDVHRVQRILEQALESDTTLQPMVGQQAPLPLKFLRPAHHFLQGGDHADRT
jgi:transposase